MKRFLSYCLIVFLLACSKKQVATTQSKTEVDTKNQVKAVENNVVTPEAVYESAFQELNQMLEDEQPISFKRAVFVTENAYWNQELSYELFNEQITFLSKLCQSVMKSRELLYDFEDKEKVQVYASVFATMMDTLPIQTNEGVVNHLPFRYDFNDFWGSQDWLQMFVVKLINTKQGNCHSLPYLYKILVEELGEKAYLSLAPNHIYIKQQNKKDGWYNTELTSGIFPNDAWLMASGYIHLDAIRSGIYMDTLSQKESIALCMIDLGQGYKKKFGLQDGKFILKSCDMALKHFPNYINAMLLKAETLQKLFFKRMKDEQVAYPSQMFSNPEAKKQFDEMERIYAKIHKLGYRKMPENMYLDWLVSLRENRDKYENKKITNFTNTNR